MKKTSLPSIALHLIPLTFSALKWSMKLEKVNRVNLCKRKPCTKCIPGPPQALCVSSKRSDKSIKIRWKEPAVNPQAVIQYEAEIVGEKSRSQEWSIFKITGCEKFICQS